MSTAYENFGKYVLLEKLATGGMAEVFLARGTGAGGIGKFFAIKRILPQYADSPEFIDMFKDEAKIAINLNHSNIVSIHEFGVEKGQFFLVMDYVEGRNLRQILNKMKKTSLQFSIDQIVFIIKEVAAGLDHAHRCIDGSTGKPLNITHRDMSPQNVMVSFEGEVKIVDFGIAKAESQIETTRAGTLKGKFGYMSPEQAEGQAVDLRTDIFSLGIVLWELLANDRLFVANNEINTLRKIRDCQIPSLRKINPNIHAELERIVQKALARDRNLRYQTGAALHRDMNRFLNRQYPDFSPQDFSVFIKSVFADEILSLRKRLVEYAKVNLTISLNVSKIPAAASAAPLTEDSAENTHTSLLDPDTNSLVSNVSPDDEEKSSENEKSSAELSVSTSASIHIDADPGTSSKLNLADPTSSGPEKGGDDERTESLPPTNKPSTTSTAQSIRFGENTSQGLVLDEKALMAEAERKLAPRGRPPAQQQGYQQENMEALETEDTPQPRTRLKKSERSPKRPPSRPSDARIIEHGQPKSARLATFLVFSLLCVSFYAYLVKYFNTSLSMSEVIRVTDPVLHDFHVALGVNIQEVGPRSPASPGRAQIPVNSAPANTDPDATGLVVTSTPSGAEILLNGQSTGVVTPTRIDVPPQTNFSITIRKHGYKDYWRSELTRESLGHRLDANLEKLNVAYLDVEFFPPQDAALYVNGKAIPVHNSLAREILVPGNSTITVHADSRSGLTYDEVKVAVKVDQHKVIRLNPRRKTRTPANSQ